MLHSSLVLAALAASLVNAFPARMNLDNNMAMRALGNAVVRRVAGAPPAIDRRQLPDGLSALPAGVVSGGGSAPYSFNFGSLPITDTINIPISFDVPGVLSTGKKEIPQSLYVAPLDTDARGGCPGLNIMANYGFLSHDGITNPGEIIYALSEMLGNTIDIALGLIGLAFKAGAVDLTTMKFSIGGTDSRTSGPLSFILGPVEGLFSANTHNRFEVDGSTGFNDFYFNPKGLNATRFAAAYARAEQQGGVFDDAWIGQQKYAAWSECIATNPTCTWSPAVTMLFYAAQAYAELTMPSSDTGVPNTAGLATVSSFWGYDPATQTAVPSQLYPGVDGVWYRRATPINAANLVQDGVLGFVSMPTQFGSNNGQSVNSFSSIENPFSDLTSTGVGCFIFNTAVQTGVPASYGLLGTPFLSVINQFFTPVLSVLGCSTIN